MSNRSFFVAALMFIGLAACRETSEAKAATETIAIPAAQRPKLADIALSAATTRAQIVAVWGDPFMRPADSLQAYELEGGQLLWLTFADEQPQTLTRALLLSASVVPKVATLLNVAALTQARRCSQLDFGSEPSARDVHVAWGPPDNVVGSGIQTWRYKLANGSSAMLVYYNDRVSSVQGCP